MDAFKIDGHKLYWHMDRIVEWQQDGICAPVYVEVSPVSFCNHNCSYCGVDFARVNKLRLDTGILKKRLTEAAGLGVRSIMYAGEGEPLLHPDIREIIKHTKESGIDVALTTNGVLADEAMLKDILPYTTWIKYSVDAGTEDTYRKIHKGQKGDFARVQESLRAALRLREHQEYKTAIGVQFLVLEENLHEVEGAIELFSEIGVDYIVFKPFSKHPQMIQDMNECYDMELIEKIGAITDKYKNSGKTSVIFRKSAFETYSEGKKEYQHCRAVSFWGYISSDGSFYTCSVFIGDEKFATGNINESDMETILFGAKRRESLRFCEKDLKVGLECRVNCRMARINEFLEFVADKPDHINFI